ncbi:MAG: hypothetical protein V4529_16950 [Gemmatimonadota bacterium]
MSITRLDPNTIFLGGNRVQVNDLAASEAITPGHLVDRFNSAGVIRWRKHATASIACVPAFATEHSMANKGVSDAYALADLVEVSVCEPGAAVWAFIASGQNIVAGNKLESAGDGTLKIFSAGVVLASSLENKPSVSVLTRIRVEVV